MGRSCQRFLFRAGAIWCQVPHVCVEWWAPMNHHLGSCWDAGGVMMRVTHYKNGLTSLYTTNQLWQMARHCVPGTPISDRDPKEKETDLPLVWFYVPGILAHVASPPWLWRHFSLYLMIAWGGLAGGRHQERVWHRINAWQMTGISVIFSDSSPEFANSVLLARSQIFLSRDDNTLASSEVLDYWSCTIHFISSFFDVLLKNVCVCRLTTHSYNHVTTTTIGIPSPSPLPRSSFVMILCSQILLRPLASIAVFHAYTSAFFRMSLSMETLKCNVFRFTGLFLYCHVYFIYLYAYPHASTTDSSWAL